MLECCCDAYYLNLGSDEVNELSALKRPTKQDLFVVLASFPDLGLGFSWMVNKRIHRKVFCNLVVRRKARYKK